MSEKEVKRYLNKIEDFEEGEVKLGRKSHRRKSSSNRRSYSRDSRRDYKKSKNKSERIYNRRDRSRSSKRNKDKNKKRDRSRSHREEKVKNTQNLKHEEKEGLIKKKDTNNSDKTEELITIQDLSEIFPSVEEERQLAYERKREERQKRISQFKQTMDTPQEIMSEVTQEEIETFKSTMTHEDRTKLLSLIEEEREKASKKQQGKIIDFNI